MIKRYYRFRAEVFVPLLESVHFGGVVMHRSFLPSPISVYAKAVVGVMEDYKKMYGQTVHPEQVDIVQFERIR